MLTVLKIGRIAIMEDSFMKRKIQGKTRISQQTRVARTLDIVETRNKGMCFTSQSIQQLSQCRDIERSLLFLVLQTPSKSFRHCSLPSVSYWLQKADWLTGRYGVA
jgi:hypothetical protein